MTKNHLFFYDNRSFKASFSLLFLSSLLHISSGFQLTIPNFLRREISPGNVAVGYTNVDGKLYKVDSEGNLFDAHTNKLKRGKKNG